VCHNIEEFNVAPLLKDTGNNLPHCPPPPLHTHYYRCYASGHFVPAAGDMLPFCSKKEGQEDNIDVILPVPTPVLLG
jgi:hypothetical protein